MEHDKEYYIDLLIKTQQDYVETLRDYVEKFANLSMQLINPPQPVDFQVPEEPLPDPDLSSLVKGTLDADIDD